MAESADNERRWPPPDRGQTYRELDHPADIFLEVYGRDLPDLFENALFALYDQLAELDDFEVVSKRTIRARGQSVAEALRNLLSEALYVFESESFVAMKAQVLVTGDSGDEIDVTAELGGEKVDKERHRMSAEVKAVTYHQLSAEQLPEGGWRATVLFDV